MSAPPVRVVQFTDTHLFADRGGTLRGIDTLASLQATLQQAAAHIRDAALILVTGDLVHDEAGGYAHFRGIFGALGRPIITLPGNHDDVPAMQRALRGAPFQYCGHADFSAWRIVMLDSVKPGSADGIVGAQTLQALRQSLQDCADRHVLICLHHQPIPMRSRWLDTVGLENSADFFATLDAHRHVRAVLWGHVHQSYDAQRAGVRLLATPSTCAQFLPHSDDFAIDPRPPAYRILELLDNGQINTEVIWLRQ